MAEEEDNDNRKEEGGHGGVIRVVALILGHPSVGFKDGIVKNSKNKEWYEAHKHKIQ